MGSFQQIVMGVTCLAAAFFFGSYLHNRPAEIQKTTDSQVVPTDPLDSIFAFGKKPAKSNANQPAFAAPRVAIQNQNTATAPATAVLPAIAPSELAPTAVAIQRGGESQKASVVPTATRRPVVPDFSELASRFRNTPLELDQSPSNEVKSSVHQSERVPWSGVFKAPEMVIRQPENTQPLQNLKSAVDQVEESIRNEFAASTPQPTRWRVNRSDKIDQFQSVKQPRVLAPRESFEQDGFEQRETIDDVLSRRSADWLKDEKPIPQTWATNPPQEGWMSGRRREVTQKAAMRSRDILEVEDPGNRFQSFINEVEEISSPGPDFDTSYYTPSTQRQDSMAPPAPTTRIQTIQSGSSSDNWNRQSNVGSGFQSQSSAARQAGNRYEGQRGDTLQSISVRFYGTPAHYIEIYKANREVLDRITSSLEGVVLKIPKLNN